MQLLTPFFLPVGTVWAWSIRGDRLQLGGVGRRFRESLPPWHESLQSRFDDDDLGRVDP